MFAHTPDSTKAAAPLLRRRRAGYTLVEIVGVLLVIAIIAAVAVESVLEKMKQTNRDVEAQNLTNIVVALTRNVTRAKVVPAMTNMARSVAGEMAMAPNWVANTAGGNTRWFWVDPACSLSLPYTQSVALASAPSNVRVAIISSLAGPLPSSISLNATTFSNVWNTPANGVPAGWSSSWAGSGADLKIQRTDLGSLFHRVLLENLELAYRAPYAIESGALTNLAPQSRRELWVIDGSAMNLSFYPNYAFYSTNSSPTNVVQVQGRDAVKEDTGYVFEHGRWGRYVFYGRSGGGGSFGDWVDAFLHAPAPPSPKFYATQQAVVDPMYDFMYYMGLWGQLGYPPDANPAQPHIPAFVESNNAQVSLDDVSGNLVN